MNTSKDTLARLLATENITVSHKQAKTASFNVRDRILTLPMWDDMRSDTYDHLVGHEVGHALYTPEEGWHESTHKRGQTFRSFLNVIEDARIEKLIQKRYQGLRTSFVSSYRRMLADGFFGGDIKQINNYGLIDRINTYFKCGRSAGVRIEADEQPWIDEIETLETWDQVVDLTERLYDFCKQKQEEENADKQKAMDEMAKDESQEDTDGSGSYDFDDSDDEDESESGDSSGSTPDDEDEDEDDGDFWSSDEDQDDFWKDDEDDSDDNQTGQTGGESSEEDLESKTDQSLRNNIAAEHGDDDDIKITNVFLNDAPINDLIISAKEILENFKVQEPDSFDQAMNDLGEGYVNDFMNNNKRSVNYMAKEFEMKKSASAYSRQTVAKTGVIDPVKMNSYRYNDDIFRKVTVTPDGKSHGIIMYVDWSGSMMEDLKATIDQMLNLVLFCRQVKIPYRVYAFTNNWYGSDSESATQQKRDSVLRYHHCFRLLEFFNNNMNRQTFNDMMKFVLCVGRYYDIRVSRRNKYSWEAQKKMNRFRFPRGLALSGTPLDETIMAAMKVHDDFQKKNRLDIVNTIFLTDGDSHPMEFTNPDKEWGSQTNYYHNRSGTAVLYVNDPVTKKRYRVTGYGDAITKVLLDMYRERTGSTVIGYRIMESSINKWTRNAPNSMDWYDAKSYHMRAKKEKFVMLEDNFGYDRLFLIHGGKNLEVSNTSIAVGSDATKAKIRTAFKKANGSRKESRKMLSDLIESIA